MRYLLNVLRRINSKYYKKSILSIILILTIITLSGCDLADLAGSKETKTVSGTEIHFDTVMSITLYGEDEKALNKALEDSFHKIESLEEIFSAQLDSSELSVINRGIASGKTEFNISNELRDVIECAIRVGNSSNGALDITIGNLINLWGIGTDHEKVPTDEEIETALENTGLEYIGLDADKDILSVKSSNVQLNVGAVAKGYAADVVKNLILEENPGISGILDFGGNIITIGSKTDGSKWKVGIKDPIDTNAVYGGVSIDDLSVVTSGNYERYFTVDNIRYHHILNPASGYPADNGIISATIIGKSSMVCDAYSTACFCLGINDAIKLVNSNDEIECILIDNEGNVHLSDNMSKYNFIKE